jgi:hypothetical protein
MGGLERRLEHLESARSREIDELEARIEALEQPQEGGRKWGA